MDLTSLYTDFDIDDPEAKHIVDKYQGCSGSFSRCPSCRRGSDWLKCDRSEDVPDKLFQTWIPEPHVRSFSEWYGARRIDDPVYKIYNNNPKRKPIYKIHKTREPSPPLVEIDSRQKNGTQKNFKDMTATELANVKLSNVPKTLYRKGVNGGYAFDDRDLDPTQLSARKYYNAHDEPLAFNPSMQRSILLNDDVIISKRRRSYDGDLDEIGEAFYRYQIAMEKLNQHIHNI